MREPTPLSLAGSLLISHPGLLDPNFRRTVIFLSSHDAEEGAFGVILNRPSGSTVASLLPRHEELQEVASVPVLIGGPVAADQLIFASFTWIEEEERMECRHHISLEEAQECIRTCSATVRAFIGYAGWSKGQLEGEISQHAWMVKPPDEGILMPERSARLWKAQIGSFGPMFRLIAEAPENPTLN